MTNRERTEVFMFLGFVLLCAAVVLVVIFVDGSWNSERWDAVAAIATTVQAIGVIGALIYAGREHRIARDAEEARRRETTRLIIHDVRAGLERLIQMFSREDRSQRDTEVAIRTVVDQLDRGARRLDDDRAIAATGAVDFIHGLVIRAKVAAPSHMRDLDIDHEIVMDAGRALANLEALEHGLKST